MTATTTHEAPSNARMNGVLFLLSLSVLINYIDRSNLSIAAELIKDEIHISDLQLGTLLSAFFWTYALMQIPAGWLVDRFDVKWVFAAGFLLWSAATAVTGLLHGFAALLIIRVILGLGESVAFPSYGKVLGSHFKERPSRIRQRDDHGGTVTWPCTWNVGGRTCRRTFWMAAIFSRARLGSFALAPAVVSVDAAPNRQALPASNATQPAFSTFCGNAPAWGTCIGQSSINYFLYFLVTWLPSYLQRGRHLSLHDVANAGGTALPGFRDFLGSDRKTVGPLDPGGSFADAGAQRLDAVRPHSALAFVSPSRCWRPAASSPPCSLRLGRFSASASATAGQSRRCWPDREWSADGSACRISSAILAAPSPPHSPDFFWIEPVPSIGHS